MGMAKPICLCHIYTSMHEWKGGDYKNEKKKNCYCWINWTLAYHSGYAVFSEDQPKGMRREPSSASLPFRNFPLSFMTIDLHGFTCSLVRVRKMLSGNIFVIPLLLIRHRPLVFALSPSCLVSSRHMLQSKYKRMNSTIILSLWFQTTNIWFVICYPFENVMYTFTKLPHYVPWSITCWVYIPSPTPE